MRESKTITEHEWLTVKEACKYIRMGQTTFYDCIKRGLIKAKRPPRGRMLVHINVLKKWLGEEETGNQGSSRHSAVGYIGGVMKR